MRIIKATVVYFSATGSTKKICQTFSKEMQFSFSYVNITPKSMRKEVLCFDENELVVIGVPVYGGRVPRPAIKTIEKMRGDNTPIALIATYGNRDYDDALLEIKGAVNKNGFKMIGAAAFIAEHSIMHSVAAGRPDLKDMDTIHNFAQKINEKISLISDIKNIEEPLVKGNKPYRVYNGIPLKPQASELCIKCGKCINGCPVGAISASDPSKTNKNLCISCMYCISICHAKARTLNPIMLSIAEKAFYVKNKNRKEAEIFI